jgi:hypothetical protein
MATPEDLERAGNLLRFEPDPLDARPPMRRVFMTRRAHEWCIRTLPGANNPLGHDDPLCPAEQFDAYLTLFVNEPAPLIHGMPPKVLTPKTDGICELRTTALRMFGWFWRQGTYIISGVGLAAVIKSQKHDGRHGYTSYIRQAKHDARSLGLDPPAITLGELHDLV